MPSAGVAQHNASSIKSQLQHIFSNFDRLHSSSLTQHVEYVDNREWLDKMDAMSFFSDVGRNMRVSAMLKRDAYRCLHDDRVQGRLLSKHGMSLAELSYQAFQAFDFLHLYTTKQCNMQVSTVHHT